LPFYLVQFVKTQFKDVNYPGRLNFHLTNMYFFVNFQNRWGIVEQINPTIRPCNKEALMGRVFIDRREGERRIGERRDVSPEGLMLMQRRLETMPDRRMEEDRRQRERRRFN
jgi:hypothetical protein